VKIGAVVLAAGSSSRLGQPKQLLRYRGQNFVRRVAAAALGAGCSPIAVIVGAEQEMIGAAVRDLEVQVLPNESWQRGMGTSIRAGVDALRTCDALIILACDQPHVDAKLIRQLVVRHQQAQKPMVACAYAGTLGVPALFARACFDQLLSLGDEQGAKALLTAWPNDVARVDFPAGAIDIDAPDDYRDLPNDF
jgi:molybdenum cofactor cytidylyltransferase